MPQKVDRTEISESQDARKTVLPTLSSSGMSLPLHRKLLLTAATAGVEMLMAFEYLYTVPLLQILGVPVTFLSLYPIITSPANIVILNLCGRLTDKGSNHKKRKIIAVVVVSLLCLTGVCLILVANLMTLSKERSISSENESSSSENYSDRSSGSDVEGSYNSLSLFSEHYFKRSSSNDTETSYANNSLSRMPVTQPGNATDSEVSRMAEDDRRALPQKHQDNSSDLGSLPIAAVLAFLGQGAIDMGADLGSGSIRACVLVCSSSNDHTVLLVLALVLAALGGCAVNILGLVDVTQVFGLGTDHGSLVGQATVQLVMCGVVLIITTTSTVLTALLNIRTPHQYFYTPLERNDIGNPHIRDSETSDIDEEENEGTLSHGGIESDNTGINISDDISNDYNDSNEHGDQFQRTQTEGLGSQFENGCKLEGPCQKNGDVDCIGTNSVSSLLPGGNSSSDYGTDVEDDSKTQNRRFFSCSQNKLNFIAAFVCGCLASSSFFPFSAYSADFLGKVVMGGDSTAPHDSAEFRAYSQGVSLGAGGLLIFFSCYLVISVIHGKLLDFWGVKVDFCLAQLLVAVSVLCMVLSEKLAAYYVSCLFCSFLRAVFYTVPFIIAGDYAREQEKAGEPATGKTLAILMCMAPLSTCVVFSIGGPLITLTQYPAAPLVLSAACSLLGFLLFGLLYKS